MCNWLHFCCQLPFLRHTLAIFLQIYSYSGPLEISDSSFRKSWVKMKLLQTFNYSSLSVVFHWCWNNLLLLLMVTWYEYHVALRSGGQRALKKVSKLTVQKSPKNSFIFRYGELRSNLAKINLNFHERCLQKSLQFDSKSPNLISIMVNKEIIWQK